MFERTGGANISLKWDIGTSNSQQVIDSQYYAFPYQINSINSKIYNKFFIN